MTTYSVTKAAEHDMPDASQQQQPPTYFDSQSQQGISRTNSYAPSQNATTTPPVKPSFGQRFHTLSSKAGWPLNKAANVIGAEGWWPTSVIKECNKAARILHSFTSLSVATPPREDGPMHATGMSRKSMVKIPDQVLKECKGLAIFNVIRAGAFNGSLAAGSGVVIARRSDGTWSPPSSFVVSTIGAGFMLGLDVYDCVCVLNSQSQVDAFTHPRLSLGGEASIAVGPVGTGGSCDAALSKTARPMWTYMKSRGLWAGIQIDGTIIVSRADANSVFYNERGISAKKILTGDVAWPAGGKPLFEVLKAIEGSADFDRTVVQEVGRMAPPGDTVLDEKHQPTVVQVEQREQQLDQPDHDETVLDEKERLARAGY